MRGSRWVGGKSFQKKIKIHWVGGSEKIKFQKKKKTGKGAGRKLYIVKEESSFP